MPLRSISRGTRLLPASLALLLLVGCSVDTGEDWPPSPQQSETGTPLADPVAQPAVTMEQLLTVGVPSLCGLEAGRLVDGVLPGLDRSEGIVELKAHVAMLDGTGRDPLTLVALNPDPHVGELAAVAAFTCDQGGVEWPDQLVGYDADLNILGTVDPAGETGGQRDLVWNLAWDGENEAATFDWSSQYPGEASCCGTMRLSGTVEYTEVSDWDGIDEAESQSTTYELQLRMPELIQVSVFAGKFFTTIQDEDWGLVEMLSATPEISAEIRDHETPQRLLTKEWVPESRAICLPTDHELHSEYGASFFTEHDAQYYCFPKAEYFNGKLVWQPGIYVGGGAESGTWSVNWMTLYLDAG
ncbi:hypothetical protein C5E10_05235 [Pseudoclavibacter sp. RFBG4]|nr:hypothetical protein C5E10_05235 [Pseudoclavibacter sp. RFBG4]